MTEKTFVSWVIRSEKENYWILLTASFNIIMEQIAEMSRWKQQDLDNYQNLYNFP